MGASNFTRPENASKYFVVLTNTEEKYFKCNDCKHKQYEYEADYLEPNSVSVCPECESDNLEWDEEYRSPEEWEVEDLKSNLFESLQEKFPEISDTTYQDNDRNYPSSGIADIRKSFMFAGIDMEVNITIIMTSAYYEGATLDYLINFNIGNYYDYEYSQLDELTIDDLTQELSVGMAKIQLPNVIKKIRKEIESITTQIEEVYTQYSDQYNRVGGFSDGTSLYSKIEK